LYATPSERDYRLSVFYDQWLFVEQSNKEYEQAAAAAGQKLSGPMFEINGMSDLTTEEFEAKYTGELPEDFVEEAPVEAETQESSASETQNLAASNLAGFTVTIRNQGSCGSCWAFSAVGVLEKFYYDKTKTQVDFSQQELVDCDKGSSGCNGGHTSGALEYAAKNGLSPASKYPYKGSTGSCKRSSSDAIKIGNSFNSVSFSQSLATSLSSKGVTSGVSVYSSGKFRNASSSNDVLDAKLSGECNQTTGHAINMVSASGDTVRVFNSWGTRWGEGGFKTIRICSSSTLWGVTSKIRYP
jgi:C1A family cysteine protease